MSQNDGWITRLGPVLRTLGFAAVAFAILWAVAPHLTVARSSETVIASSSQAAAAHDAPSSSTTSSTVTTVAAAPTTVVPRVASGTALRREQAWDDRGQAFVEDPEWPGSLKPSGDLTFEVYPTDESKDAIIYDRSLVEWTIRVTNQSDERLWGLFVYLELAGRATCDARVLDPGESATCTVEDIAFFGPQTADVWATAWDIDDSMSSDRLLHPYAVAAKPSND